VKELAERLGLTVTDDLASLRSAGAELGVVVAYGQIIPSSLLALLPMVNLHFSLLPRWRGAAPVERAILAGDATTGVCLMEVVAELDAGGLYGCEETAIGPLETADQLTRRLALMGRQMLVSRLAEGRRSLGEAEPQTGEPTWAPKLSKEELKLDFSAGAPELERLVRAGRAWTTLDRRRLIVHSARAEPGPVAVPAGSLVGGRVATGDGWLALLEVQLEGRRPQSMADFLRGARPGHRGRLGEP
jgi:methionyl-tRNA formyltransferase